MIRRRRRNSDAHMRALERMVAAGDVSPATIIKLARAYERENRVLPSNGLLNRYECAFVCFFGSGESRTFATLGGVRGLVEERVWRDVAPEDRRLLASEINDLVRQLEATAPGACMAFYDVHWIFVVTIPAEGDNEILEFEDYHEWRVARHRTGLDVWPTSLADIQCVVCRRAAAEKPTLQSEGWLSVVGERWSEVTECGVCGDAQCASHPFGTFEACSCSDEDDA